jgi:predicted nucleic acid-binding protein
MGLRYLYDTNIFIYYFSGTLKENYFSVEFIEGNQITISTIVRMEVLSHPNIKEHEEAYYKEFLNQFKILPIDSAVEDQAINIRRKYKVKLPDAIIAATAMVSDSILVTKNTGDFRKITGLKLI